MLAQRSDARDEAHTQVSFLSEVLTRRKAGTFEAGTLVLSRARLHARKGKEKVTTCAILLPSL